MYIRFGFLLMFLTLFLTACDDFDTEVEYRINPMVVAHVDKFFTEAEQKGIYIPRTNLIVLVSDHNKAFRNGAGQSSKQGNQRIIFIWNSAVHLYGAESEQVENLVFHELGHSLLNRNHCNNYSIMNSGLSLHEYAGYPDKRIILIKELFSK